MILSMALHLVYRKNECIKIKSLQLWVGLKRCRGWGLQDPTKVV